MTDETPKRKPSIPTVISNIDGLRYQSRIHLERVIHRVLDMSKSEMATRIKSSKTSALELMIIQVVLTVIRDGDAKKMNDLLSWIHGRPTERLEVHTHSSVDVNVDMKTKLEQLDDEMLLKRLGKIKMALKKAYLKEAADE